MNESLARETKAPVSLWLLSLASHLYLSQPRTPSAEGWVFTHSLYQGLCDFAWGEEAGGAECMTSHSILRPWRGRGSGGGGRRRGSECVTCHSILRTWLPALPCCPHDTVSFLLTGTWMIKFPALRPFFLFCLQALSPGDYLNHTHSAMIDDSSVLHCPGRYKFLSWLFTQKDF